MYLGNVVGLVLVLTTVPIFASILRVPFAAVAPMIVVSCAIGAYAIQNAMFDIWLMLGFGVVGYVFKKIGIPLAPFLHRGFDVETRAGQAEQPRQPTKPASLAPCCLKDLLGLCVSEGSHFSGTLLGFGRQDAAEGVLGDAQLLVADGPVPHSGQL